MPITSIIKHAGGFGTDEELYGRRMEVPDYPELEEAQKKAMEANKNILPEAEEITSRINTFNQAELERMLRLTIPDLDEINANVSGNIATWTRGEVGKGVEDLLARKSAESAVAGGYGGSGMHRNLEARDLGLTSLRMTQRGMSSAERWLASVRQTQTTPMADVTSMFISPAQKFSAMEAKWSRDLYAETMAAAPDPVARGKFDAEMEIIGMVLSAYGGGAGYKQTYQQQTPGRGGGGGDGGGGQSTSMYQPPATFNSSVAPQAEADWQFKLI